MNKWTVRILFYVLLMIFWLPLTLMTMLSRNKPLRYRIFLKRVSAMACKMLKIKTRTELFISSDISAQIMVGNSKTFIDWLILMSVIDTNTIFVLDKHFFTSPFLFFTRGAEYIMIDHSIPPENDPGIDNARSVLERGKPVFMFINRDTGHLRLTDNVSLHPAYLSTITGISVTPVAIALKFSEGIKEPIEATIKSGVKISPPKDGEKFALFIAKEIEELFVSLLN